MGKSLAETVRLIGNEVDEKTGRTRLETLVRSLYAKAIRGKVQPAELLFSRGWGRALSFTELNELIENGQMVLMDMMEDLTDEELERLRENIELLSRADPAEVERLLSGDRSGLIGPAFTTSVGHSSASADARREVGGISEQASPLRPADAAGVQQGGASEEVAN